jgi:hypothetical protein
MDYKGHNYAAQQSQSEMLGYWFSITGHPHQMQEDANYFSRLGKDIQFSPLLKDYLSFARQAYFNGPPSSNQLNDQNMPDIEPRE